MDGVNIYNTRKKTLTIVVSSLLTEVGFDSAEKEALEILTEVMQSVLCEMGTSSRAYAELAGRSEPVAADVIVSLVNMGICLDGIEEHACRSNRTVLPSLIQSVQPKQLNILTAGVKHPHPPYVPGHLPQFPDPHAYIRTPTHKQPVTEYEAIREKAASQKRDVERALTRFIAKTGETHSLFLTEDTMFPLIACKPQFPPYIKALLPQDQVFDFEDEFTSPQRARKPREMEVDDEELDESKEDDEVGKVGENDLIDNPYLRPVKVPRKKKPKI